VLAGIRVGGVRVVPRVGGVHVFRAGHGRVAAVAGMPAAWRNRLFSGLDLRVIISTTTAAARGRRSRAASAAASATLLGALGDVRRGVLYLVPAAGGDRLANAADVVQHPHAGSAMRYSMFSVLRCLGSIASATGAAFASVGSGLRHRRRRVRRKVPVPLEAELPRVGDRR
jgi:hypothetical protein